MRRSVVLLVGLLALVACDRELDPPTSPSPSPSTTTTIPPTTARALLQPVGVHTFPSCNPFATCIFAATLINNGAGCALRVEGTVRLFDATGLQLGGPYRFTLPAQQIVQPGERVAYAVSFVPYEQAIRVASYLTDPLWIDTPCR